MPNQPPQLDRIFHALADSTRRAVLAQLSQHPAPVSVLAEPFAMALPSFLQHLRVLEDCGLVRSEKSGRVRTYRLTPEALETAEGWLREHRALWERRLDQLDDHLKALKEDQ